MRRLKRLNSMEENKDIFDRIMELPGLRLFNGIYKKNKEVLLYLFFGVLTTVVSIAVFAICNITFGINELVSNVISWIVSVAFAFFTNRIWVFAAPTKTAIDFIRQMVSFYGGRVLTLLLEELIIFIFVTILGLPGMIIKLVAQIIVIVGNYVISKLIVFKKKRGEE